VKAAGLVHRSPYALRHSFATFAIAAGVSLYELARFMGTSVEQIDRTYGHLLPDSMDRARQALDAFVGERTVDELKESLILAAEDMDQAIAAAVALRTDTSDDKNWRRALETAVAVSYMRPFTTGGWKRPGKYAPRASAEKGLHRRPADPATTSTPIPTRRAAEVPR